MIKLDGLVDNRWSVSCNHCFKQLSWIAVFYFKISNYPFIIRNPCIINYNR